MVNLELKSWNWFQLQKQSQQQSLDQQLENLTISTDDEGSGVISCKVTADGVQESPVFSRSVSYYVVGIRNVVKIEQYNIRKCNSNFIRK